MTVVITNTILPTAVDSDNHSFEAGTCATIKKIIQFQDGNELKSFSFKQVTIDVDSSCLSLFGIFDKEAVKILKQKFPSNFFYKFCGINKY